MGNKHERAQARRCAAITILLLSSQEIFLFRQLISQEIFEDDVSGNGDRVATRRARRHIPRDGLATASTSHGPWSMGDGHILMLHFHQACL